MSSNQSNRKKKFRKFIKDIKEKIEDLERAKELDLGPLQLLPGRWKSVGQGWNMIALPFPTTPGPGGRAINYRLLLNQYDEELDFSFVDDAVPNRGISFTNTGAAESDQTLVALDYQQTIQQVSAIDNPPSDGLAGDPGLAIHHEPGLWLHMENEVTSRLNVARLANIPHGNSVLAMGVGSDPVAGGPNIPEVNGLPIGAVQDINHPYLSPYKHFADNPFVGTVDVPGFPGFNPVSPNDLLALANQGVEIERTTELHVDTEVQPGGINNIPFIERQADASAMESIFWIQELKEKDRRGNPKLRLQYTQTIFLDFFPRFDGTPGLIRWPHVSINTLEKVF